MELARRLAVNADDFGFTTDVNRGIVETHINGILTSTTLMANGAAFGDAIRLARQHPTLDVGVHFVLVGGSSLSQKGSDLPGSVSQLIHAMTLGRIRIQEELRAQILRILDAGILPTHLDTHKHTHLLPPVLLAVARLGQEFDIPWVRRPFDLPLSGAPYEVPLGKRLVSRSFQMVRRQFHRVLSNHGCRTTDYFAGFQMTGRFGAADVSHLIRNLPEGTTEFMCHPGFCGSELRSAQTRLKESREQELRALTDPALKTALAESGVELTPYSDLTR